MTNLLEPLKAFSRPLRHRLAVLRGKDLHITRSLDVPVEFHGTEYRRLRHSPRQPGLEPRSSGRAGSAKTPRSTPASSPSTAAPCTGSTRRRGPWRVCANVADARFQFHPAAISGHDGMLRLYLPRDAAWVSASLVAGAHTRDEHIDVPTRRLAALRDELGVPDVLKMDIEGAEYDVLRDLLTGKDRFLPPQIAVEFHHFWPAFGPPGRGTRWHCWLRRDTASPGSRRRTMNCCWSTGPDCRMAWLHTRQR